jgi:hypothetical protein
MKKPTPKQLWSRAVPLLIEVLKHEVEIAKFHAGFGDYDGHLTQFAIMIRRLLKDGGMDG